MSLHCTLDEGVCVDHLLLDKIRVIQVMYAVPRYYAALFCPDRSLSSDNHALKALWIAHFWGPCCSRGDGAFLFPEITDYLGSRDIILEHMNPRRHRKIRP